MLKFKYALDSVSFAFHALFNEAFSSAEQKKAASERFQKLPKP